MQKWEYLKLVVSIGNQADAGGLESWVQSIHFTPESEEYETDPLKTFLEPYGKPSMGYESYPHQKQSDWETYRDARRGLNKTVMSSIHQYGCEGWELVQIHKETFERDDWQPPFEHPSLDEPLLDKGLRFIEITEYWFKRPLSE